MPFYAEILGAPRAMCCMGCQLAGQSIVEAGLSQYYLDRQSISRLAPLPEDFYVYNHKDIQAQFVYSEAGQQVAELSVIGLRCAACSWLIESRLQGMAGVGLCQVNLTQSRARITWQEAQVSIGEILTAINRLGYEARPYRQDTHEASMKKNNKALLLRLGVAAIGAMQAMMFSIGVYFGDYSGIAGEHREFLRLVAMIVSVPVVFYAAVPFFAGAQAALRAKKITMDVPVSIAIVLTFVASSYAVWQNTGETYFDSVAMFVFFLLAGRYIEHTARLKAASLASDLLTVTPKLTLKLGHDPALLQAVLDNDTALPQALQDNETRLCQAVGAGVKVHHVAAGDIVQVGAGEELLADGLLLSAQASVSQSLLTGEGELVAKYRGDKLLGGSQNDVQPFIMLVTSIQENSELALIDRLVSRSLSEKPEVALEADRMARWFVGRVLLLALIVFVGWWWIDPSQAIWATVAVLVATCPCALSLATPIALTVATNRLAFYKLLATRGYTIPTLAKVTHVAFDKTGTLTTGTPTLLHIATDVQKGDCLALAAALESGSHHPLAKSLTLAAKQLHLPVLHDCEHYAGGGVAGSIGEVRYRLGHKDFAKADSVPNFAKYGANMAIVLTSEQNGVVETLAWFYFNDVLRQDVKAMLDNLQTRGITPLILTGDPSANAEQLGKTLAVTTFIGLTPKQKVAHIQQLQKTGAVVLMVGDGINDAPVLAAADVSIALASGTDLAQVASDAVLLEGELQAVTQALTVASTTTKIIRQNLRWAFAYNSLIILPAALGYVPPYLAALGMSLSSLLVVLNALRIKYS